jgi:probable F420-dependent oxidoreductase
MREPQFGVALENFCPAPDDPSIDKILAYAAHAESLGFASVWAWDHILLGTKRPFPFLESIATLTAVAARTRRLQLGIGVLVLPLRNPVVLAKELASLDQISKGRLVLGLAAGWYEREFQACGISFKDRGKTFVRNLEILRRLWTEDQVEGMIGDYVFNHAAMLPKPFQRPHPPLLIGGYVDRVLRRVARYGDGWLTYFYTTESFRTTWAKIRGFAEEQGRDPAQLRNLSQLPICVGTSFEEADRSVRDFIGRYFDVAPWSESTPDSAIRGTPAQCAEQIAAHLDAGVEHVVLIPSDYRTDQLEAIAREVLPRLRPGARPVHA